MHLTTAKLFVADDLTSGGLDKRRSGKEDVTLLLDDDGLVTHGGDVGTAGGARTHDDGDLRNTLGTHAGLVVEDATEVVLVGEDIGLVRQIGATAVDEVDAAE
jgi:hypothetical protein